MEDIIESVTFDRNHVESYQSLKSQQVKKSND